MLGHVGWIQRVNFTLCGVMVIAAGAGMLRAIRDGRGLAVGGLAIASARIYRWSPHPVQLSSR
jgi:hypothetical protein